MYSLVSKCTLIQKIRTLSDVGGWACISETFTQQIRPQQIPALFSLPGRSVLDSFLTHTTISSQPCRISNGSSRLMFSFIPFLSLRILPPPLPTSFFQHRALSSTSIRCVESSFRPYKKSRAIIHERFL